MSDQRVTRGDLFGDGRERDDVHHASQAMPLGMAKPKRQGRERLATARRDGERKHLPGVKFGWFWLAAARNKSIFPAGIAAGQFPGIHDAERRPW